MKLQLLLEADLSTQLKAGQSYAVSELTGLVSDPAGLYMHIVKGLSYDRAIILSDTKYWNTMFTYWDNIDEQQRLEILDATIEAVKKHISPNLNVAESIGSALGTVGKAIGSAASSVASWAGRQISGFVQFLSKLHTTINMAKGYGGYGGMGGLNGARAQKQWFSNINAVAITTFVDMCIEASKQNLAAAQAAQNPAQTAPQPVSTKKKYAFEALDAQGNDKKGTVHADSDQEASDLIKKHGLFVTKLTEVQP